MSPSLPTNCPQCGASVPASAANTHEVTCLYCGSPLSRSAAAPVQMGQGASGPVQSPTALPLEFSGLKRPKPTMPANAAGCVGIVFGVAWFLFSIFFSGFSIHTMYQAQQTYDLLKREGQVIFGAITDLEIDNSGDSTDYVVHYRYTLLQNNRQVTFNDKETVDSAWYRTLKGGQAIEVIYARSQPQVSRLKAVFGPPNVLFNLLFIGFSLIFVVIGIAILVFSITNLQHYSRLRGSGQETLATVFDLWQDSDSEGDPTYAVAYAFRVTLPDGTLQTFTHAELNQKVYKTAQIGSHVRVRYVQDAPEINHLV